MTIEPVILIHGGAWEVPNKWVNQTLDGVKFAATTGYRILQQGGSGLDAIEAAIGTMEDNEHFNSGRGGCLNLNGEVALDASIQRGSDLSAGCVALLKNVRHPISLAKKILEDTPHTFIAGVGASHLAKKMGLEIVDPSYLITDAAREEMEEFLKTNKPTVMDTVGAVVIDSDGHVFAGTSTGGTPGKYVGRIGDAPLIGCGTYADDFYGAVSTTGHGETITKYCLARVIINNLEKGMPIQQAVSEAVEGMTARLENRGGAIALSNKGDVGFHFTTSRMSWCYVKAGKIHYGIEKGQHEKEDFVCNTSNGFAH